MASTYTIEQIGARARQRNPEALAKFTDTQIGQRLVERNPELAKLVAPSVPAAPTPSRPALGPSAVNVTPTSALPDAPRSTASFIPQAAGEMFTGATQEFGKTLGSAGAAITGGTSRMDTASVSEADARFRLAKLLNDPKTTPEQKERIRLQLSQSSNVGTAHDQLRLPTAKQVIGQAVGTGLEALSGGALAAGSQGGAATLGKAALKGAGIGAIYGGVGGGSVAARKDETAGQIVDKSLQGAAVGAVIGGAMGAASYKISKDAALRAEQQKLLSEGASDARVAEKKAGLGGGIVRDKAGVEAVKQGIDPGDVAVIKTASPKDKAKMTAMLNIRERQATNKMVGARERATDVVGDTFVEKVVKPLEKLNKEATSKMDGIAGSLKGKTVDFSTPINTLNDDLQNAGVKIQGDQLDFTDSDFADLPGPQSALKRAWSKALKLMETGDAYEGHRTKRYIDEFVNYGKQEEGLGGRAATIVKRFRHDIDGVLDTNFDDYNKVNTVFKDTIDQLDTIGSAIGKTFTPEGKFADAQAGQKLRGLFQNTKSRTDFLGIIDNSQDVLKKYGVALDEDIIRQAAFADSLEGIFGAEATAGFQGGIERGVEKGLGKAGQRFVEGKPLQAVFGYGAEKLQGTMQSLRGVSPEAKMNALKGLLK